MKSFKVLFCGLTFAMLLGLIGFFSFGSISVCYADVMGGGIYIVGGATYTLSGGTISSTRKVDYGGGVILGQGSTFTLSGGHIKGNEAIEIGGGVYNCGTMKMTSGSVENNTSNTGAGVYVADTGTFTFSGGAISNNIGTYWGGGVYADGGFIMSGGTISGNTAPDSGGGVYVYNSMTMNSGKIEGNTTGWGAGIYDGGDFTMEGGTISGNTASETGGGVYVWDTATMNSGNVDQNKGKYGGGYYISSDATFNFNNGKITKNRATMSGGGIYINGVVNMKGGEISGNTAGLYGSGVYISPTGTLNYEGGTISDNIYLETETSSLVFKKAPTSSIKISLGYGIHNEGSVTQYPVFDKGTKIAKLSGITTLDLEKISVVNASLSVGTELGIQKINNEYWIVIQASSINVTVGIDVIGGGTLTQTGEAFNGNLVWGSSEGSSSDGSGSTYTTTLPRDTMYERVSTYCIKIGEVYVTLKITQGGLSSVKANGSTFAVGSSGLVGSNGSDELVIKFECSKSTKFIDTQVGETEEPQREKDTIYDDKNHQKKMTAVLDDKKFFLKPVKADRVA